MTERASVDRTGQSVLCNRKLGAIKLVASSLELKEQLISDRTSRITSKARSGQIRLVEMIN